jgi:hypothetical protein
MANLKGSYYYTQRALGILDATPKYYVYLLKHPQTNEVFYVGKGEDKRMYQHVRDAIKGNKQKGNNHRLHSYIKRLLNKGLEPSYEKPIEDVDEVTALALEAAFIDYYGLDKLCNYLPSGFGTSNHTDEMKKVIAEKTKAAMQRPEMRFLSMWTAAANHFQAVTKKYGTMDNYNKHKAEVAKKKELQENLKLLDVVMGGIRKDLMAKKKAEHKRSIKEDRNILVCDRVNNIYKRKCYQCGNEIVYAMYESLMACARRNTTCLECMGKKVSINKMGKSRRKWTDEEKKAARLRSYEAWDRLSVEEQERIKAIGRENGIKARKRGIVSA